MSGPGGDGKITLTWAQVTYGVAVLVILVGGWFDLRFNIRGVAFTLGMLQKEVQGIYSKAEVDQMRAEGVRRYESLEARIERLEKANEE